MVGTQIEEKMRLVDKMVLQYKFLTTHKKPQSEPQFDLLAEVDPQQELA